jgi:hypothetical protein
MRTSRDDSNLPWSKSEIIEAVRAEIESDTEDETSIKPVQLCAFIRLALGKPEGRASPKSEDELMQLISRVYRAIDQGRDPEAAYEVPLPDEAPMHHAYRHNATMLDIIDAELREGAEVTLIGAIRDA